MSEPARVGRRPPGAGGDRPTDEPIPARIDDDELDDGFDEDPADLGDGAFDREWPDDEEDVVLPDAVPEEESPDVDAFPTDDEDDDAPDPTEDLDVLEDLSAADDTDIPVIESDVSVRVDGRVLPGRVEWARTATVWVRPAGGGPDRDVVLELAGRRLTVRVAVVEGDQECVLLGRDLLKGRFLLRA